MRTWSTLIVGIMVLSFLSCQKEKFSDLSVCESSNPVEEVKWLQELMKDPPSFYRITLYELEGQKLVEVYPTLSSCYGCHFYSCEGERIVQKPDDWSKLKVLKTIWPKEYQ